jgi:hydroxymethylglutaryl-CoA synthase
MAVSLSCAKLEFSASAGGAAYVFGKKNVLAEVTATVSYTTDTPDFWRREGRFYPRHAGRFTGEPAYFKHVSAAARALMDKARLQPKDFRFAVFHMPNGKFPLAVGATLGFSRQQLETGWVVPKMGNTYSGSSPTGLAAVLDVAEPGDRILLTSFGSGAGSDGFALEVTSRLPERRQLAATVRSFLEGPRRYLSYGEYAKFREKIILND